MRTKYWLALLGFVLWGPVYAVLMGDLAAPQDNGDARNAVVNRPESQAERTHIENLIRLRIFPLTLADVTNMFGQQIAQPPEDMVLPVAEYTVYGLSGLMGAGSQPHVDWYAIGDLGYLMIYFKQGNGTLVDSAYLYERADEKFVPLKSVGDYAKRLEWDTARLAQITKWLDQHRPKVTDLGNVEVSTNAPTHFRLENGGGLMLRLNPDGSVLIWIEPPPEKEEERLSFPYSSAIGQTAVIRFNGGFYRLTPRLKRP